MIEVGCALQQLREEEGWTQEDLAACAGISASALSRIERGVNGPKWATVERLLDAAEVTFSDLLDVMGVA